MAFILLVFYIFVVPSLVKVCGKCELRHHKAARPTRATNAWPRRYFCLSMLVFPSLVASKVAF